MNAVALQDRDPESLAARLRGHRHLPYAYLPGMEAAVLERHAAVSVADLLTQDGAWAFAAGDAQAGGLIAGDARRFDTRVLGVPAGRVATITFGEAVRGDRERRREMARSLVRTARRAIDDAGWSYVTARVDAREIDAIHALETEGFHLMDGILRFVLDLDHATVAPPPPGIAIRDARAEDVAWLRPLAASSFSVDRFHSDPAIPDAVADDLHGRWVENAVGGRTGCGVVVAEVDGTGAGFFVLAEDPRAHRDLGVGIGNLVLVAVEPAFRGRGVAAALTRGGTAWFRDRGHRFVEVGTQLANGPAGNLYLGQGFRLAATEVTLRWWDGTPPAERA